MHRLPGRQGRGGEGLLPIARTVHLHAGHESPGQPVTCRDYLDGGKKCPICIDGSGKLVKQECYPVMPPTTNPVMCEEKKFPDGTVCSICTDAMGHVVRRGCRAR